jgi:hypothetical protein
LCHALGYPARIGQIGDQLALQQPGHAYRRRRNHPRDRREQQVLMRRSDR